MTRHSVAAVLLGLAGVALPAQAQDPGRRVELHGFGGWTYGRTNTNRYLTGVPEGSYRQGSFALNFSSHLTPALSIIGQTFWRQDDEKTETEIDYAFAEWRFSDALKVRLGKVKQPFGLYAEVFDVGTLRPFLSLPQSIYGPVGAVAEGFQGIGLRGSRPLGHGWSVAYDLYGGGILLDADQGPINYLRGEPTTELGEPQAEAIRDLVGTRVVLSVPVPGLSLGGSAYTGSLTRDETTIRQSVIAVQAEYLSDRLSVRGEFAHQVERSRYRSAAGYLEAGYFLTRRWQLAALYDKHTTHLDDVDVSAAPSLVVHDEFAGGLNYWLAPEVVVKGSFHTVNGNRLAGPLVDLAATIATGGLRQRTRLIQVGAQFSF